MENKCIMEVLHYLEWLRTEPYIIVAASREGTQNSCRQGACFSSHSEVFLSQFHLCNKLWELERNAKLERKALLQRSPNTFLPLCSGFSLLCTSQQNTAGRFAGFGTVEGLHHNFTCRMGIFFSLPLQHDKESQEMASWQGWFSPLLINLYAHLVFLSM